MPRRKITPERKNEIIEGLYKCLASTGHEQVTIKDIARAANLSYGVIHYYFDSKKQIMLAVVDDFISRYGGLVQDRLTKAESAWDRLRIFITFAVERLILDPEASMFFLNLYQMAMNDEEIRSGAMSSYAYFRRAIRGILKYGIARGEFADVDVEKLAFLYAGCIEGMWLQMAMDPDLFDRETIETLLFETIASRIAKKDSGSEHGGTDTDVS